MKLTIEQLRKLIKEEIGKPRGRNVDTGREVNMTFSDFSGESYSEDDMTTVGDWVVKLSGSRGSRGRQEETYQLENIPKSQAIAWARNYKKPWETFEVEPLKNLKESKKLQNPEDKDYPDTLAGAKKFLVDMQKYRSAGGRVNSAAIAKAKGEKESDEWRVWIIYGVGLPFAPDAVVHLKDERLGGESSVNSYRMTKV